MTKLPSTRVLSVIKLVTRSFLAKSKVLTGNPTYKVLPSKVIVSIPYFSPISTDVLTDTKINALATAITKVLVTYGFKSTVELRFIRLQYPYLDSSILAQYVAINAGKYNMLRMQKMMFKGVSLTDTGTDKVNLPSQMTGVKLELAGRLTTQRSIPRKTVENGHIGSFTVNKTLKSSLDFSQYASKNKLNAFTIKV